MADEEKDEIRKEIMKRIQDEQESLQMASNDKLKKSKKEKPKINTGSDAEKKPKERRPRPTPEEADAEIAFATEMALDELERIMAKVREVEEEMEDMAIADDIVPLISVINNGLESLYDILVDNVDLSKLTPQGKRDYKQAQRIRAHILARVHNKYKKEE